MSQTSLDAAPGVHAGSPNSTSGRLVVTPAPEGGSGLAPFFASTDDLAGTRILVIDDTPAIHADFRKILVPAAPELVDQMDAELFGEGSHRPGAARFLVDSAFQGEEGVKLVQQAGTESRPYALAFLDVRMPPGWDGIQTASRLWAADPNLQIVLCTAYSDHSWAEIIRQFGQTDSLLILKKPFDNVEVLQLAHALVRKWLLARQSERRVADLDGMVNHRTRQLRATNDTLLKEIVERKGAQLRLSAFSALGQRLSAAQTVKEAAQIIVETADQLLGWDACLCDLYSAAEDRLTHVLNMDLLDGKRVELSPRYNYHPPTGLARRVIAEGGQLVLRDNPEAMRPDGLPFGDLARPSASILYVPIRNGTEVIGVLSIQSYTVAAYDPHSLETLQALADHCGGALERIRKGDALQASQARLQEQLTHIAALSKLGHNLSGAKTAKEAGEIIVAAADQLLGLDAFTLDLYSPEQDLMHHVLNLDTVDGQRVVCPAVGDERSPTVRQRRAIESGGHLILKDVDPAPLPTARRFGDTSRPSASIMYVPVRDRSRVIGVISLHSYTPKAYDEHSLETLQALADHCGGALERIKTEEALQTAQEELRQSQKLEAIGQLAGGVAHDFNNLLAVIQGNAELALMEAKAHSPQATDFLKQITTASERAANLTRQLLAFGRKQLMQSRPVLLNEVIANLTKMLRRLIGEHIDLQCHYGAEQPYVKADVGMLEQILVNLVVNARDAMPQGGQLLITTEHLRFDNGFDAAHPEARPGPFVCLAVKDSGTGIAPEHLPRIFEPFFTTKELGKGTGLGLATVYGIVKQHQGWIEVSSRPGAGSTFKIFLPAVPPPDGPATAPPPARAALPRGNETILLVEDDPAVRAITRRVVESVGYKVCEATCAREALQVYDARADEIALLLTDIVMPEGVTGRRLAEQLLARRPELRVILMSGYSPATDGLGPECFGRTTSRFLQKPCSARELIQAIRECLDGRQTKKAGAS